MKKILIIALDLSRLIHKVSILEWQDVVISLYCRAREGEREDELGEEEM